jgi:hypothetical protein
MSSITNQIVANIKQTSTNFNSSSFVNSENVICIDTSTNRIGINRKNPVYSIDISGNSSHNALRVYDLHINNLAKIKEISCNEISCNIINADSFHVNNIDVSDLTYKLLSGDTIDVSLLNVYDISISYLFIPSLLSLSLDFIELSGNNIYCTYIKTTNFDFEGVFETKTAIIADLSCTNLTISNELITDTIKIENSFISEGEASFNHFFSSDACLNNLIIFNELSSNGIIKFNELSGKRIDANFCTINGQPIVNEDSIGNLSIGNSDTPGTFSDLTATKLNVSNLYVTNELINYGTTNLGNGALILPDSENPLSIIEQQQQGSIAVDCSSNILKIYNESKWNNILLNLNYANMSLCKSISGNEISYNIINEKFNYFIADFSNLILNGYPNYKYIPINFDNSGGNKLNLSNNNKTITVKNPKINDIFEIHATVGIRYLNRNPGDVEPNDYTIGIYPNIINTYDSIRHSIDNSFVTFKNSVIAFDNSYNFANTSINYIGPLVSNSSGFNFYISSNKDISYIYIHQFNGTIKQL